jgi:hypothetical protein
VNLILAVIESPYAADTLEGVEANLTYARRAMKDSLARGEAPIASHLLYTQPGILDDKIEHERNLGINAGLVWARHAKLAAFYIDLGWSRGMYQAWNYYQALKIPVEKRSLHGGRDALLAQQSRTGES